MEWWMWIAAALIVAVMNQWMGYRWGYENGLKAGRHEAFQEMETAAEVLGNCKEPHWNSNCYM